MISAKSFRYCCILYSIGHFFFIFPFTGNEVKGQLSLILSTSKIKLALTRITSILAILMQGMAVLVMSGALLGFNLDLADCIFLIGIITVMMSMLIAQVATYTLYPRYIEGFNSFLRCNDLLVRKFKVGGIHSPDGLETTQLFSSLLTICASGFLFPGIVASFWIQSPIYKLLQTFRQLAYGTPDTTTLSFRSQVLIGIGRVALGLGLASANAHAAYTLGLISHLQGYCVNLWTKWLQYLCTRPHFLSKKDLRAAYIYLQLLSNYFNITFTEIIYWQYNFALIAVVVLSVIVISISGQLPTIIVVLISGITALHCVCLSMFVRGAIRMSVLSRKFIETRLEREQFVVLNYDTKYWKSMRPLTIRIGNFFSIKTREYFLVVTGHVLESVVSLLVAFSMKNA